MKHSKNSQNRNAQAYLKQREIVYLYKNEISQEEYFTDQHQKSIPGSFAQQQEDSIPDKDWVQAAQIVNPIQNFEQERLKADERDGESRSLEEIKASIAKLSQKTE